MDNQYNYYNPNENSNNEDRQRMNSQSEGSQNGEQKGNTPQWQPGGDHLKKEKKPQVLLRLPCYDFTPITSFTFGGVLLAVRLPTIR